MANFAITFLGTSFPIPDSSFARVDATHFVSFLASLFFLITRLLGCEYSTMKIV